MTPTETRRRRRGNVIACLHCRARKIRCDNTGNGEPCTNCRFDEQECIITQPRRRRRKSTTQRKLPPDSASQACNIRDRDPIPSRTAIETSAQDVTEPLSSICNDAHITVVNPMNSSTPVIPQPSSLGSASTHVSSDTTQSYFTAISPAHSEALNEDPPDLPAFIQPITTTLDRADISYLRQKNVFCLPQADTRGELLRCYFKFVHSLLPVIDPKTILDAVDGKQSSQPISLMLFWALLYPSTAFIDTAHLRRWGFKSRLAARKDVLAKVKLLHDLNYETDPLVNLQAMLLMTYWYDNPDDPQSPRHFLTLSLSYLGKLNINEDAESPPLAEREKRLRRRIFWSCFIQHSLISMATKQHIPMDIDKFLIPALVVPDFDVDLFPAKSETLRGMFAPGQALLLIRELADMCVGILKLCLYMRRIQGAVGSWTAAGVDHMPNCTELLQCEGDLERWYRRYGPVLSFDPRCPNRTTWQPSCEYVEPARAVMTSIYLKFLTYLYETQINQPQASRILGPEIFARYMCKISEAANQSTAVYEQLRTRDLIRFMPNIAVPCLVSAATFQLKRISGPASRVNQQGLQRFQSCLDALEQMRELYNSADVAYRYLHSTLALQRPDVVLTPPNVPPAPIEEVLEPTSKEFTSPEGILPLNDTFSFENMDLEAYQLTDIPDLAACSGETSVWNDFEFANMDYHGSALNWNFQLTGQASPSDALHIDFEVFPDPACP